MWYIANWLFGINVDSCRLSLGYSRERLDLAIVEIGVFPKVFQTNLVVIYLVELG